MKWVTRRHVHVDRVASPWLISKFVDKDAEFIFVPWPGPLPSGDMGIPFDYVQEDIDRAPEARGVEAIAAGAMCIVKDDYQALEKGFFIYDALYAYVQFKKLREEYKDELAKMDRSKRFDFLKARIKKPPEAKIRRPSKRARES